jgi:probable HAF family extracellular repeat protein
MANPKHSLTEEIFMRTCVGISRNVLAAVALLIPLPAMPQQYTVTDLGPAFSTPNGGIIGAFGINNAGQVVGGALVAGSSHAVLWQPGNPVPTDLGTLGGNSYALGINDGSQVVGRYGDPFGSGNTNGFVWDLNNGMRELPPLSSNVYGTAGSINAQGQSAGESSNYSGDPATHAVLWNGTVPVDLGTLPNRDSSGAAYPQSSINAYGEVVGVSGSLAGTSAFLWLPTVRNGSTGSMFDLGTLGGSESVATVINGSGMVAGVSRTASGVRHPFLWTPSTPNGSAGNMIDLGTLGGADADGAQGINDAGVVIGTSLTSAGVRHPFVYSAGVLRDLNDVIPTGSGWELLEAFGINNTGQTVGYGVLAGQIHSFLLTPAPSYAICLLYDATKAVKSGSTLPVKVELCDRVGKDLSSSSIALHVVSVTQLSNSISGQVQDAGNANPDSDFRFDSTFGTDGGYIFNLKTTGLTTGTYNLGFTVSGSPVYTVPFQVK